MTLLDHTFSSPEENLACDEALLESLEANDGEEVLRFWESPTHFVVLGSSNTVQNEVHVEACHADRIPILRRHSGGGTVLQGPGCLNYSLVLPITPTGTTHTITSTTHYIMNRHAKVLSRLVDQSVEVKGSSDLAIAGKKFSGNAQRRRLRTLLFHGTFLLDFNLPLIAHYLKMPAKQPAYREQRDHLDFVRNIGVHPSALKELLKHEWNASKEFGVISDETIGRLVREKYSRAEWNFRL